MDNQSAQPNNRVLTVGITLLAVVVEVASAVLTVPPFRWAMAPLGGPIYDVLGGFIWPLMLHAAAVGIVLQLRRHRHQTQIRSQNQASRRRLLVATVGTIALFTGIGSLTHHGLNLVPILITMFVSVGGPVTLWMVLHRPETDFDEANSAK